MSLSQWEHQQVVELRASGAAWSVVASLLTIDRKAEQPLKPASVVWRELVADLTVAFGPMSSPFIEGAVVNDVVRNGL